MGLKKNDEALLPHQNVLTRPDYSPFIIRALRAVANGKADERQQVAAMEYIIKNVCGTYDMPFRPGPVSRETDFALGKQHCGQTLVFFINSANINAKVEKQSIEELGIGEQPNENKPLAKKDGGGQRSATRKRPASKRSASKRSTSKRSTSK